MCVESMVIYSVFNYGDLRRELLQGVVKGNKPVPGAAQPKLITTLRTQNRMLQHACDQTAGVLPMFREDRNVEGKIGEGSQY